ncbi:hypothetical protein E2C01_055118 [Portunus trituberculatus]|uniref:Uncharacterized protein n=1 Tax=Portunus trituberculatus TaxID=210409 RepID=A0A5B7GUF6_PORTR|nr:hypothetical protein [Portunus trituberculatus]
MAVVMAGRHRSTGHPTLTRHTHYRPFRLSPRRRRRRHSDKNEVTIDWRPACGIPAVPSVISGGEKCTRGIARSLRLDGGSAERWAEELVGVVERESIIVLPRHSAAMIGGRGVTSVVGWTAEAGHSIRRRAPRRTPPRLARPPPSPD